MLTRMLQPIFEVYCSDAIEARSSSQSRQKNAGCKRELLVTESAELHVIKYVAKAVVI